LLSGCQRSAKHVSLQLLLHLLLLLRNLQQLLQLKLLLLMLLQLMLLQLKLLQLRLLQLKFLQLRLLQLKHRQLRLLQLKLLQLKLLQLRLLQLKLLQLKLLQLRLLQLKLPQLKLPQLKLLQLKLPQLKLLQLRLQPQQLQLKSPSLKRNLQRHQQLQQLKRHHHHPRLKLNPKRKSLRKSRVHQPNLHMLQILTSQVHFPFKRIHLRADITPSTPHTTMMMTVSMVHPGTTIPTDLPTTHKLQLEPLTIHPHLLMANPRITEIPLIMHLHHI
jgi:ribosomal protein S21